MIRRVLLLLGVATLLAVAANAVSPRGLSWKEPLGRGLRAELLSDGFPVVELKDVKALLDDLSVVFVDARSNEEYKTGHLRGAIQLARAMALAPADRPVVVYCGNEFCGAAHDQARFLRKLYRNVAVFVDGYDAWWNAGGAVEQE
jgi:rhodanese-related sulfurtransferase